MKLHPAIEAIFGIGGQQSQQQVPQQQQPQQQVQTPAPASSAPAAPDYSQLWTVQQQQNAGLRSPLTIDQQKLVGLAKSKNFLPQGIPQDAVAALMQGDASKLSAFFNAALQFVYNQATTDAAMATSAAFDVYGSQIEQHLPGVLQNFQVTSELGKSNPLMSDPAFAPMVSAAAQQMRAAYPNASAQDIQKHVENYFQGMASKMGFQKAPEAPAQDQQQQQTETDWGAFGGFDVGFAPESSATSVAGGQPTVGATQAGPTGF